MTLSITLTTPPHDTPATYALVAGQHVLAPDCPLAEADSVSELLEDLLWRRYAEGVAPGRGI
jgi:hypothetical protein